MHWLHSCRKPAAHGTCALAVLQTSWADLEDAVEAVGEFGSDNRAGIQGTLHRISGLRNRQGRIIGLTCRVGRAVTGHADIIRDVLEGAESVLWLRLACTAPTASAAWPDELLGVVLLAGMVYGGASVCG